MQNPLKKWFWSLLENMLRKGVENLPKKCAQGTPKEVQIDPKSTPGPSWDAPWTLFGAPNLGWSLQRRPKETLRGPREAPRAQKGAKIDAK